MPCHARPIRRRARSAALERAQPRSVRRARSASDERGGDVVVRAFQPAARAIDLRLVATGELRADDAARAGRALRGCRVPGRRDADRPTTASASRFPATTSSRSTIRIATAGCSPTSTCTCSAKARTTARSRSSARIASRSATSTGVHFAVWAPNAERVSVVGDFNGWDGRVHPMRLLVPAGVWELFVPDLPDGESYKFEIRTRAGAPAAEDRSVRRRVRGAAAARRRSSATSRGYEWRDEEWMARAAARGALARSADVDLRGAPRLVGARAGGRQSLPDLSRAGAPARAVRARRWASRTSSCCR